MSQKVQVISMGRNESCAEIVVKNEGGGSRTRHVQRCSSQHYRDKDGQLYDLTNKKAVV